MRDLAIRGAGDILGKEQAGFIDSIGVNMYLDLIKEEVEGKDYDEEEIKENKESMLNVSTHIGNEYTDDSEVIINLHKKINGITNKKELNEVLSEIKDRFGITNQELELYAHEKYIEKRNSLPCFNSVGNSIYIACNIFSFKNCYYKNTAYNSFNYRSTSYFRFRGVAAL